MHHTVLTTHNLAIGYQPPPHLLTASPRQRVIAAALNLELHAGELVCLLGPNGVGKTTLLRTLAGMHPPLAGRVRIAGADIAMMRPAELAQHLSVVLTERIDAGNLTVAALVALGRHPHTNWLGILTTTDQAIITQALESTGAAHLAERHVHELSDGERQRVMIARALAQEPLVMILDEPTAFLDLPSRVEVMRLLRALAYTTSRAMLLSTHDLDLALRSADLLWLMAPGGTVHIGAPEDLVLNGAFETAFQHEGVQFDRHTGTFAINTQTNERITLHGTGLAATWTMRALQRGGFQVMSEAGHEPAPVQVVVNTATADGTLCWQSTIHAASHTHTSLYDLVRYLRHTLHQPERKSYQ